MPCGIAEGSLPAGLQLAAAVGEDELLLSAAACVRENRRMRVQDCNWMQLEEYLRTDDRIVLPLGSVEQHGYLSLAVDQILSERVAVEAAEPLGVPVLPALPYGITPYFAAYPGSPTLRSRDVRRRAPRAARLARRPGLPALPARQRPRRQRRRPARAVEAWSGRRARTIEVLWHNWWNAPRTWAEVQAIDPDASHASWLENFPWTRLAGRRRSPESASRWSTSRRCARPTRAEVREMLGDGSFGGLYERPDEDVLRVWRAGVEEVRRVLENGWRDA